MADRDVSSASPIARDKVEMGSSLLELADELGLSPEGALWFHDASLKEWRYYLVTSVIDVKGAAWVYKRLLTAFKKLPKQDDFLSIDVHLGSPKEILFKLLSMAFRSEGPGPNFIMESLVTGTIDDVDYSFPANIVIYRMLGERPAAVVHQTTKTFDRSVREIVAA